MSTIQLSNAARPSPAATCGSSRCAASTSRFAVAQCFCIRAVRASPSCCQISCRACCDAVTPVSCVVGRSCESEMASLLTARPPTQTAATAAAAANDRPVRRRVRRLAAASASSVVAMFAPEGSASSASHQVARVAANSSPCTSCSRRSANAVHSSSSNRTSSRLPSSELMAPPDRNQHCRVSCHCLRRASHQLTQPSQCTVLTHPHRTRRHAEQVGHLIGGHSDGHPQDDDLALCLRQQLQQSAHPGHPVHGHSDLFRTVVTIDGVGELPDRLAAHPGGGPVGISDLVCRDAISERDERFSTIDVFGQGSKHRYAHLLRYVVSGPITPVVRT